MTRTEAFFRTPRNRWIALAVIVLLVGGAIAYTRVSSGLSHPAPFWLLIIFVNVPFAIVSLLVSSLLLYRDPRPRRKLDRVEKVLVFGMLGMFATGLILLFAAFLRSLYSLFSAPEHIPFVAFAVPAGQILLVAGVILGVAAVVRAVRRILRERAAAAAGRTPLQRAEALCNERE